MKLPKSFYNRSALEVSKDIIGLCLVHNSSEGITKGRIVEVEAYMGTIDAAAHSYKGPKGGRTSIQYREGGYAYIYLIYGMYYCINIVTNTIDVPESILIRALEPMEGISLMKKRRKTTKLYNLCSGPGKLCIAMGINKENYGMNLCGDILYLEQCDNGEPFQVETSKRINIDYAGEAREYPWRYTMKDNPFISVKRK